MANSQPESSEQDPPTRVHRLVRTIIKYDSWVKKYRKWLRRANIATHYKKYLWKVFKRGAIIASITLLLLLLAGSILAIENYIPPEGESITGPDVTIVGIALFLSVLVGGGAILVGITYPLFLSRWRQQRIDVLLPHTIVGLYALNKGGVNPTNALRIVSEQTETYGSVAVEFRKIITDVEELRSDLPTALSRAEATTPSDQLATFLRDFRSAIKSETRPQQFLQEASTRQIEQLIEQKSNKVETTGALTEAYVIVGLLGPIVLLTTLMSFGFLLDATQYVYVTTYIIHPAIGLGFLVILHYYTSAPVSEYDGYGQDKLEGHSHTTYQLHQRTLAIRNAVQNPKKTIRQKPNRTLIVTVPIAFAIISVAVIGGVDFTFTDMRSDPVTTTTLFITAPASIIVSGLAVGYKLRENKRGVIHKNIGGALSSLADLNAAGMSLVEGCRETGKRVNSYLTGELNSIVATVETTGDAADALRRTGASAYSPRVARAFTLLGYAYKNTDNLEPTLRKLAEYLEHYAKTDRMLNESLQPYLLLIAIGTLMYVGIAAMLLLVFFPALPETTATTVGPDSDTISPELARMILYHSTVIQSVLGGLILGQLRTNGVGDGLLYMLLFVLFTTGAFLFL